VLSRIFPENLLGASLVETKLPLLRTEGRGSTSNPPPTILPTMISYIGGGWTATEPSRILPSLHFQRAWNTYSTKRLPLVEIVRQTFWPWRVVPRKCAPRRLHLTGAGMPSGGGRDDDQSDQE
jgi:hypothetical protein